MHIVLAIVFITAIAMTLWKLKIDRDMQKHVDDLNAQLELTKNPPPPAVPPHLKTLKPPKGQLWFSDRVQVNPFDLAKSLWQTLPKPMFSHSNVIDDKVVEFKLSPLTTVTTTVVHTLWNKGYEIQIAVRVRPHPGGVKEDGAKSQMYEYGFSKVVYIKCDHVPGTPITGGIHFNDPYGEKTHQNPGLALVEMKYYLNLLQRELDHRGIVVPQ